MPKTPLKISTGFSAALPTTLPAADLSNFGFFEEKKSEKDIQSEKLHKALFESKPDFKKLANLLEQGADINWRPLFSSANTFAKVYYHHKGSAESKQKVLEFLCAHNCDLQGAAHETGNALNYGMSQKLLTPLNAEELLEHWRIDPLGLNYYKVSSIEVALRCDQPQILEVLISHIGQETFEPLLPRYIESAKQLITWDPPLAVKCLTYLCALQEKWSLGASVPASFSQEPGAKKNKI